MHLKNLFIKKNIILLFMLTCCLIKNLYVYAATNIQFMHLKNEETAINLQGLKHAQIAKAQKQVLLKLSYLPSEHILKEISALLKKQIKCFALVKADLILKDHQGIFKQLINEGLILKISATPIYDQYIIIDNEAIWFNWLRYGYHSDKLESKLSPEVNFFDDGVKNHDSEIANITRLFIQHFELQWVLGIYYSTINLKSGDQIIFKEENPESKNRSSYKSKLINNAKLINELIRDILNAKSNISLTADHLNSSFVLDALKQTIKKGIRVNILIQNFKGQILFERYEKISSEKGKTLYRLSKNHFSKIHQLNPSFVLIDYEESNFLEAKAYIGQILLDQQTEFRLKSDFIIKVEGIYFKNLFDKINTYTSELFELNDRPDSVLALNYIFELKRVLIKNKPSENVNIINAQSSISSSWNEFINQNNDFNKIKSEALVQSPYLPVYQKNSNTTPKLSNFEDVINLNTSAIKRE